MKKNVHRNVRSALTACAIAWGVSVMLAAVPLIAQWEFYGQNGICLPLPITRREFPGKEYAYGVFIVLNFVLFLFIGVGQALIFQSIRRAGSQAGTKRRQQEADIARRLFLVVLTDFLCWFPIGLVGLLAYRGTPIAGVVNVWAAIFVLPLNSAINPFVYTLNSMVQRWQQQRLEKRTKRALGRLQAEIPKWSNASIEELMRICLRTKANEHAPSRKRLLTARGLLRARGRYFAEVAIDVRNWLGCLAEQEREGVPAVLAGIWSRPVGLVNSFWDLVSNPLDPAGNRRELVISGHDLSSSIHNLWSNRSKVGSNLHDMMSSHHDLGSRHGGMGSMHFSARFHPNKHIPWEQLHLLVEAEAEDCYHVDFQPPLESKGLKLGLLRDHASVLGDVRVFDGTILFMPRKLPDEVTVLHSLCTHTNSKVKITIKLTTEVLPGSPTALQLHNLILKRCLAVCGMKLVGRHYFSIESASADKVAAYGLKVAPGFQTSILHFEESVLLEANITHKVLHTHTVWHEMQQLRDRIADNSRGPRLDMDRIMQEWVRKATQMLLGAIVLTRYNNKTYRVDDIDWQARPTGTFQKSDGSSVTFKDYFWQAYGHKIEDDEQPLLVSRPRKNNGPRGQTENILLIPELCIMTGLTDAMREQSFLMKAVSDDMRTGPEERIKRLQNFTRDLNRVPKAHEELAKWQMTIDTEPVQINARRLPDERLFVSKDNGKQLQVKDSSWQGSMTEMLVPVELREWLLLYPREMEVEAKTLCNYLTSNGRSSPRQMGMNISMPKLPKVAFTVVKKRINTRFVLKTPHGLQNPPAGTVVDTVVTRPEWYDYYLISQSVRQGTVGPTHYNVIWDTTGLNPSRMQRLTYKLAHQYFNWQGTISVPATCQYAHKLAYLTGMSLHKEFDPSLANKLFFL
nr:hypothetical protein BaRGS_002211 [Batillaria attramentaria]